MVVMTAPDTTPGPGLTEALEQWRAIEQAATKGPWGTLERHGIDIADEGWSEVRVTGGSDCEPVAATFLSHQMETDNTEADTAFIVTARTAMPRLLGAVQAVLELHQPGTHPGREDQCEGCRTHVTFTYWPCKTVVAVTRTLTGTQDRTDKESP